MVDYKPINIV